MKRALVAGCMILAGCGEGQPTVVDGSSPQAFDRTVVQARRDLPDADRMTFDKAIRTVGGRRHAERDPDSLARVTFDGMTAAEIVANQKLRDQIGE